MLQVQVEQLQAQFKCRLDGRAAGESVNPLYRLVEFSGNLVNRLVTPAQIEHALLPVDK